MDSVDYILDSEETWEMQNNPILAGLSLVHQIRETVDNPLVRQRAQQNVKRLAQLILFFFDRLPSDKTH